MMRNIRGVVTTIALLIALPSLAQADDTRILVFGDSNSWGWKPVESAIPTGRYDEDSRWPGVMRNKLGDEYDVVVNALSGRTTDLHDPTFDGMSGAGLNGAEALPSVIGSHLPLDLVVIMLGTNDLKAHFDRSPLRIALGAGKLVSIVQDSGQMFGGGWYEYPAPKVLLVAPPPISEQEVFGDLFKGGASKSKKLAPAYENIAEAAGAAFFDAGDVIKTDGVDGIHFTAETHKKLGAAITKKVRSVLDE